MGNKRMTKPTDKNFADWESTAFGFGYGTGEEHVLAALKTFFETVQECDGPQTYDYRELEAALTPTVAWLLINRLCQVDIIEYGSSPRFAWLTEEGKHLKYFIMSKTVTELETICCDRGDDFNVCYPDACNCGPNGYEKERVCVNPFWPDKRRAYR